MRGRALARAAAAVVAAALAAPALAAPATPAEALRAVREAKLRPAPLLPASLPAAFRAARAEWQVDRTGYSVHLVAGPRDLAITRSPASQLRTTLAEARQARVPAVRMRLGRRQVVRINAHHTLYLWREQGQTYGIAAYRVPLRELTQIADALTTRSAT
ncbi:MAG: hypothetical protein MUE51_11560 [Thermoleophilia bacterium]|nr:hypothetical protein [Thermoleophilia bacterium]